jgi:hypothetical protein
MAENIPIWEANPMATLIGSLSEAALGYGQVGHPTN